MTQNDHPPNEKKHQSQAGWWLTYPSEKYELVNWKDDIPYMKWKIIQPCSSHHQPDIYILYYM